MKRLKVLTILVGIILGFSTIKLLADLYDSGPTEVVWELRPESLLYEITIVDPDGIASISVYTVTGHELELDYEDLRQFRYHDDYAPIGGGVMAVFTYSVLDNCIITINRDIPDIFMIKVIDSRGHKSLHAK